MTTQIAIIDPFMITPAIQCFNGLVKLLGVPATYHQPSVNGLKSLEEVASHTHGCLVGRRSTCRRSVRLGLFTQFLLRWTGVRDWCTLQLANKSRLEVCLVHQRRPRIHHVYCSGHRHPLEGDTQVPGG